MANVKNPKDMPRNTLRLGPVISQDGSRAFVRKTEQDEVFAGVLNAHKEGQPLASDETYATISPRTDGLYDVRDEFRLATSESCGPAMVNSSAYRSGWDTIFGKKTDVGQA